MTVSGFPNWFILMGPNTGPGHTSVLVYTGVTGIEYALQASLERGCGRYQVWQRRAAGRVQDAWQLRHQAADEEHGHRSSGCSSWCLLRPDGEKPFRSTPAWRA